MNAWGIHTSIDISNCNEDAIRNSMVIHSWITRLVVLLDMEAYGDPIIARFGKEDKLGYTCMQLIQTSNICAHFAEDINSAFIDVFSCKEYEPQSVVNFCLECFGGKLTQFNINYRK